MTTTMKSSPIVKHVGICIALCASIAAGQPLEAAIDISPSVLNLGSEGTWIGCSIRLPDPYSATDIDVGAVYLNGQLIVVRSSNSSGDNVLSVKFSRSDVQDILGPLPPGEAEVHITGQLADGTAFHGTDIITITHGTLTITPSAGPNGWIAPADPVCVVYGGSQEFTAYPDTGYEVDTWSVDGTAVQVGGTTYTISDVQTDHAVHVTFKQLKYLVTPSAGPGGSITPGDPVTVVHGSNQEFTAHPHVGYEVDTWSVDGTAVQAGGTAYTICDVQANHTAHVTFKKLKYLVTPSAGPGGSITPADPVCVVYGGSQEFTACPDTGYEVDTWSVDGTAVQAGGTAYTICDVRANHAIHVTFKKLKYLVTPSAGPGGSIAPGDPVTVVHGDSQAFTALPDAGCLVDTWSVDGAVVQAGGTTYTIVDVQADHTIHVTFKQPQYVVTPSAGPHGGIDPAEPVTVPHGGSCEFTAFPDAGYEVSEWYVDNALRQTGGNTFELTDVSADHTVLVTFVPLLSYSLGYIDCDDAEEFEAAVTSNNVIVPGAPWMDRVHVERIEGLDPDPEGVMVMHSLMDLDLLSPTYGKPMSARAKGFFRRTHADEIVIRFKYHFTTDIEGAELRVYLSNVPQLLDRDDPSWDLHYFEVACLRAPSRGPGSAGSGRFAVFEKRVWTGHLKFAWGTWVELELIEPEVSNSVTVDDWSSAVQCYGICLDINWDNLIDVADFLKVIGECGRPAVGERACYEGVFSDDGVVDALDATSWDWALNSNDRLLSLCRVPLAYPTAEIGAASTALSAAAFTGEIHLADLPDELSDLLIVGKRGTGPPTDRLRDRLYAFDQDGACVSSSAPSPDRGNIRLVRDDTGGIYLVNSEEGVVRLGAADGSLVPPDAIVLTDMTEPRYNGPATVYVGVQGQGPDIFGRPVLDVALEGEYAYVVPVVVSPAGGAPYTAAAKLLLHDGAPYQVIRLYDDPPVPNDNQYRDALRELEIDGAGNLYVLNAHALNESDILWRYAPDGTTERVDLGTPGTDNYCPGPTAMHMSRTTDMLYIASTRPDEADINTSVVCGFTTRGPLALERSVTIEGMQNVVGMTEDPATGCLWVLGLNMHYFPEYPSPMAPPFYYPCLAQIQPDTESVQAQSLDDPGSHDLALPLSILWTGR